MLLLVTPYNILTIVNHFYFGLFSDETESFFLPFALLLESTFLPAGVDILSLKPCLFFLLRFEG